MSKSLLNGVNELLKKAKLIQGDSGALTTLTDSPRQVWVDTAVQVLNEVMEELYSVSGVPLPKELAESTITLATNDRDYALASDLVSLHFPLLDETNGQFLYEYNGGYLALVAGQPVPADFTGMPLYAVVRPTDGQLYLDRIPTASENGLIYKYRYDKDISLSTAAATFPFSDTVFRALIPAATELFNFYHRKEFSEGIFKVSVGRAARLMTNTQPRTSYLPSRIRGGGAGIAHPFD